MKQTFTIAALLAVASALKLADGDQSTLTQIMQDDGYENIEFYEPEPQLQEDQSHETTLAQTGQVTRSCQETFTRLSNQNQYVVADIIAADVPWTDPDYSKETALFNIATTYSWGNANTKLTPTMGYSLFTDGTAASVSSFDMIQGGLGDCWLIAAIASVASDRSYLYRIFNQQSMNAAGIYSLNLWSSIGVPVTVVVDDYFPLNSAGTPAFAKSSPDKEIWPILLEKAVSKLIANYDMTTSGTPNDGMLMLTGGPGFFYLNSSKTALLIHADIVNFMTQKHFVQAQNNVTQLGLIGSHAYSILGAFTLSNGVKLIQVRNPWGFGEWTGAYNDKDAFWTNNPTMATEVGFSDKTDGSFFMTADDFKLYFYNLSYTPNTTNLVRTSWVQIGNADTFGIAGNTTYCGTVCKQNTFTIKNTSTTAKNVYLVAGTHRAREYGYKTSPVSFYTDTDGVTTCNAPFVAGKQANLTSSASHYFKVGTAATLYNEGTIFKPAVSIAAGGSLVVVWEIDWRRSKVQKDIALTAWANGTGITITQMQGKLSSPGYN